MPVAGLPSNLSSNIRGIKGLNHGLDRFCGFHGKRLKELFKNSPLSFYKKLSVAKTLKGLITNDDMLTFLSNSIISTRFPDHHKITRYFLKNYGRDTIMNWLTHGANMDLISDTSKQYYKNHKENPENKITLPNSNNLTEIHDIITGNVRRLELSKTHKNIDYTEVNKKFNKYEFVIDSLTVRAPKDSQELIDISCSLSNCLSAYTNWHGYDGVILFVEEDNSVKYAISINNSQTLEQFYGKYNQLPEKQDYNKIINHLDSKNLIKDNRIKTRMENVVDIRLL
jgi:hypothetical protein